MKRLIYLALALTSVPAVSLMSDPKDLELGFVGTASVVDLEDSDVDEAIAELEKEGDTVEIEEEVADETESVSLTASDAVKKELKEWRASLTKKERRLLRKLVKKRRKRFPDAPTLNKKIAQKILKRGQDRIAQRKAQLNKSD